MYTSESAVIPPSTGLQDVGGSRTRLCKRGLCTPFTGIRLIMLPPAAAPRQVTPVLWYGQHPKGLGLHRRTEIRGDIFRRELSIFFAGTPASRERDPTREPNKQRALAFACNSTLKQRATKTWISADNRSAGRHDVPLWPLKQC